VPREDRERHATYVAACEAVAANDGLLALADLVPPPQLRVNVFLAAVHDLLLRGEDHVLATRYRSVCERRGLTFERAADAALGEELASFCAAHRDELVAVLVSRRTQTNEVGRCGAIRAALAHVASRGAPRVGLLDVGCSAGLNLFVDAYGCDYGAGVLGPAGARPVLRCELRGAAPPTELPEVAARVGLDLSPIDATDRDEVDWLLACLWPDDLERFERLEAAIDVAAARRGELDLVAGDMVTDLALAASRAGDAEHLVVMNCWSAAYVPPVARGVLAAEVAALGAARRVTWVTMEHPVVARDLGVLDAGAVLSSPGSSAVCATTYEGTAAHSELLAECHSHGLWLDWRG
jgi:hypothetical protein